MKRTLAILAIFMATGCARPLYRAKSDAEAAPMRGAPAMVRETVFDNPGNAGALPDTGGTFGVYTEITYNRAGNIVSHNSFRGPDSLQSVKEEYFYDPSGERMLRSESHDLERHSTRVLEYGYDERGNLTSESERTGAWRADFIYDRRGYLKKEINNATAGEAKSSETRYKYDRRGLLTTAKGGGLLKKYYYHPGGVVAEIRIGEDVTEQYDRDGNLTGVTHIIKRTDEKGRITTTYPMTITARYEYDGHGNWTRRTQFYGGQAQSVAVREIEYFGGSGDEDR